MLKLASCVYTELCQLCHSRMCKGPAGELLCGASLGHLFIRSIVTPPQKKTFPPQKNNVGLIFINCLFIINSKYLLHFLHERHFYNTSLLVEAATQRYYVSCSITLAQRIK